MTNEEQLIIKRMDECMTFQNKLEKIEANVLDASYRQKEALNSLYDAIDELVIADAEKIGVLNHD